jgi:hypothetical protein
VEDNVFKTYLGNYDYYKSVKDKLRLQTIEELVAKSEKIKKPKNIDENKKKEAEQAKVETRVENLENEIKELDLAMAATQLEYEELNKLYCRKDDLSKELDAVMELWLSFNN